uniref:Cyclic GMP-AMP synthase n=1 Tax=Serinus canaria TaxID=9135 RepID=A0A8C9MXH8_SERCA
AEAPHGRALAAVQHLVVNAGAVAHAAAQPVQGVHLPHEVPLPDAAEGRVAGHFPWAMTQGHPQHRAKAPATSPAQRRFPRRGDRGTRCSFPRPPRAPAAVPMVLILCVSSTSVPRGAAAAPTSLPARRCPGRGAGGSGRRRQPLRRNMAAGPALPAAGAGAGAPPRLPRPGTKGGAGGRGRAAEHLPAAARPGVPCGWKKGGRGQGSRVLAPRAGGVISEPNEFDIMLVMPVPRIQLNESDDTGAYYYVSFKRIPKEKSWLKFLEEDGTLSAFKMLQALREIIKQEVKNIKDVEVTVARKKAGSPAITLQIKNPPSEISVDIILTLEAQKSWPPSTQDGLKIEQWLGTKKRRDFRFRSIYLVAKQNKREKVLRGNTWRLSFSHIEKEMINNHGNSKTCCESDGPKCCRKGCLKLLKFLLERLKMKHPKELEKFCSYHVKTAFLHSCVTWPNDTDWHLGNLDHSFQQCLGFFVGCLQKSQLTHFFIPQYNLLSLEDKARHHFLSRKISYELNNGFPIFHENY